MYRDGEPDDDEAAPECPTCGVPLEGAPHEEYPPGAIACDRCPACDRRFTVYGQPDETGPILF